MSIRTFQGAGFNPVSTMDARMAPQARKDQAMAVIQEMNEKDKAEKEKDKALAGETRRLMKMAEAFGAPPGQVLAWDKDQLAGYVEGTMKKAVYDRDVSARKTGEKQDLRAGRESKARIEASDAARRSSRSRAITARADSRMKFMAEQEEKTKTKKTEEALGLAVLASLEAKDVANEGKDLGDPGYRPLNTLERMAEQWDKTKGTKKGFTVSEELIEALGGAKGLSGGGQSTFEQESIRDYGPDGKPGGGDDGPSLGVQTIIRNPDGTITPGGSFRAGLSYSTGAPTGPRMSSSTDNTKFENLVRAAKAGDVDRTVYLASQMFEDVVGDPDEAKVGPWRDKAETAKVLLDEIAHAQAILDDPGAKDSTKNMARNGLAAARAELDSL